MEPAEIDRRANEYMARAGQALTDRLLLSLREAADQAHDMLDSIRLIESAFADEHQTTGES